MPLAEEDMVRSRSPSRMPSHVGTMSLDSTGIVPSPAEGLRSELHGPLGQAPSRRGLRTPPTWAKAVRGQSS
ncbi:unnamed protein product [Gulo gulo]|uniref:Uncharacterized protein n=1 Tax=Gulo gulo TaxID=48420 RepID=A0A9X9LIS4_GULGU|nr:unnamed protein product [Gulo gulo]